MSNLRMNWVDGVLKFGLIIFIVILLGTSMPYSGDEDDFESCSDNADNDIDLEYDETNAPFEVNVTSKNGKSKNIPKDSNIDYGYDDDKESADIDSQVDFDELEMHGHGSRMKLSKKPPEVLLRQYQHKVTSLIEDGQVSDS